MVFCFLYLTQRNLMITFHIHPWRRKKKQFYIITENYLHQMKSWEGRAICFSEPRASSSGKKNNNKKSHSIASVHNSHPQPQIDLENLFKIIKMKKNIEEII